MDLKDATKSAMVWATDSNTFVCSSVMPNGTEILESGDLGGVYFKGTASVVELQIAKGEYLFLRHYLHGLMHSSDQD